MTKKGKPKKINLISSKSSTNNAIRTNYVKTKIDKRQLKSRRNDQSHNKRMLGISTERV